MLNNALASGKLAKCPRPSSIISSAGTNFPKSAVHKVVLKKNSVLRARVLAIKGRVYAVCKVHILPNYKVKEMASTKRNTIRVGILTGEFIFHISITFHDAD